MSTPDAGPAPILMEAPALTPQEWEIVAQSLAEAESLRWTNRETKHKLEFTAIVRTLVKVERWLQERHQP